MQTCKRIVLLVLLLVVMAGGSAPAGAQTNIITDKVFLGLIIANTAAERTVYQSQMAAQADQAAGYELERHEMEACAALAEEYNKYLDTFYEVLAYAAQAYGFYTEIKELSFNIGELSRQLDSGKATNAFAVMLSENRNDIYAEIIDDAAGIIRDLRELCLSNRKNGRGQEVNKYKMTEKERLDLLLGIRPKLSDLNRKILRLTDYIRYTTLADVWLEITERAYTVSSTKDIAERCRLSWMIQARKGSVQLQ